MYYQQKILADHPTTYFEGAEYGYLSLISESQRNVTTWTTSVTAGHTLTTSSTIDLYAKRPVESSATTKASVTGVSSAGNFIVTSPALTALSALSDTSRVHVGTYIYIYSNKTTHVTIRYYSGSWQEARIQVPSIAEPQWLYFAHSFEIDSVQLNSTQQQISFKVEYDSGGSASDYIYYFNGITIGQDAENVASVCMGAQDAYSVSSLNGGPGILEVGKYNGNLTAITDGIPLHLGVQYATVLKPWIPEHPSLTLRDSSFMSENNKLRSMTLEFWLKFGKTPPSPVRIVGPVGSTDGLYINSTTLVLSIGGTEAGYDIGTIDYPMLIHWIVGPSGSQVMLNSETVIEVAAAPDSSYYAQDLPIGFYTSKTIHPVYVSSIATYSYPVPSVVAKARFVRGQGTVQYGLIADEFDGKSHSADFSTANFANNISYPDNVNWSRGASNNLVASSVLTSPQYSIPEMINESATENWSARNKAMCNKPTTTITQYNTTPLHFSNDNTSGTAFTNRAVMGEVYTSVATASSSTNTITVPADLPFGAKFSVHGKAKYAGTKPHLKVTFVGPGTTHTIDFDTTVDRPYISEADGEFDIPIGTTSITWGIEVGNGMTFGQFNEVYCHFTYGEQPFHLRPDGYDTEPNLYWGDLNFLYGSRVAAITSTMIFDDLPIIPMQLMTVRKRGTKTQLSVYLNSSGSVVYEFSDYKQTTVVATKAVEADKQFTIGVAVDDFVTSLPSASPLFSQPSEVEVFIGAGEGASFSGHICDVSFHNDWHKSLLGYTYTDGIADTRIPTSYRNSEVSTYTLKAITKYGNYTLDVASSGYWQEVYPVSFFTREGKDRFGNPAQKLDFIQATVGKTRSSMPVLSYEPITYFKLQQNYWGRAYTSLQDYAYGVDYTELAALTYPVYDTSGVDVQTWVSLQKLSDEIVDYTQKSAAPVDGEPIVYIDDDGKRHFVQDGYAIVIPYTYDLSKYSIVVYNIMVTDGVRSSPCKLKSFEMASWVSNSDSWDYMTSKESNPVYPYIHNGSFYTTEYPSIFEVTKRGYNYLYKSARSGYKPKNLMLPGYESGILVQWGRQSIEPEAREFAGYSMFIMHDKESLLADTLISHVTVGVETLFKVYASPVGDGDRFAIFAVDALGDPYINLQWYVNGVMTTNPLLDSNEWYMLQCSLPAPHDSDNSIVSLRMTGDGFGFDNITMHGREEAVVRGVAVYRRWDDIDTGGLTWDSWDSDTWRAMYDLGTVISIDIERERMVRMLTGVSPVAEFSASASPELQEIFVIRDIEWIPMDVITK